MSELILLAPTRTEPLIPILETGIFKYSFSKDINLKIIGSKFSSFTLSSGNFWKYDNSLGIYVRCKPEIQLSLA